jgi:hypothetical protein
MKNQKYTKLKKKEIKSHLIEAIEKILSNESSDTKTLGKVRKTVKKSAEKIVRKFLKGVKVKSKIKIDSEGKEIKPTALSKRNKNLTKKLKGKPTKENVKEIIEI